MKKNIVKIAIVAVCAVLVAGVCLTCFTVVKAGHTGVVLTFGASVQLKKMFLMKAYTLKCH